MSKSITGAARCVMGSSPAGHASVGIGRKDLGTVDASAQAAQQAQQHHGTAHPGMTLSTCSCMVAMVLLSLIAMQLCIVAL